MINRTILLIAITAVFCSGCVSRGQLLDEVVRFNQPHRVIQHNFAVKYDVVSAAPIIVPEPKHVKKITHLKATQRTSRRRLIRLKNLPTSYYRKNSIVLGQM